MNSDEKAIRDLVEKWMTATKAGDTETVLSLMADDVVFMVPGKEPFGKQAFAAATQQMGGVRIDGTSEIVELQILGDWAYIRNRLNVVAIPPNGTAVLRSGYTLTILRKDASGKWLLTRDANLVTVRELLLPVPGNAAGDDAIQLGEPGYVKPAADLYSVGITLYNYLTGQLPFKDSSSIEIQTQALKLVPKSIDRLLKGAPPELSRLLVRSMATKASDRFANATENPGSSCAVCQIFAHVSSKKKNGAPRPDSQLLLFSSVPRVLHLGRRAFVRGVPACLDEQAARQLTFSAEIDDCLHNWKSTVDHPVPDRSTMIQDPLPLSAFARGLLRWKKTKGGFHAKAQGLIECRLSLVRVALPCRVETWV